MVGATESPAGASPASGKTLNIVSAIPGLYRFSNPGGGTPPSHLRGTYTDRRWMEEQIAAYEAGSK